LTAVHGEWGQRATADRRIGGRRNRHEVWRLAGDEGGAGGHGQVVYQGLMGLGIMAFSINQGEVREVPNEVRRPAAGAPSRRRGLAAHRRCGARRRRHRVGAAHPA
jgi:hypothetical protein